MFFLNSKTFVKKKVSRFELSLLVSIISWMSHGNKTETYIVSDCLDNSAFVQILPRIVKKAFILI